jgi:ABC-type branched-subunit amino acid transport system substrate-binding protein
MARNTLLWRSLAIGGSLALVLSACGSDDGDETAEAPEATDEATEATGTSEGDGTLTLGTLLPETGSLAFLGPPEFAGVALAVQEINEAGGVLGNDVVQIDSDSGDTSSNIAQQSVDTLLSQDVDAIIGAASSSVSLSVIDKITGAGVLQMSPANTSEAFTAPGTDDANLYFRTAPSDKLQGRVLGDRILNDGWGTLAIIALQDAYGEDLAAQTTETFEAGGGTVVFSEFYDPKNKDFSALIDEASSTNPDAVALIAFDETKTIIPQAVSRNFGPQDVQYYFVDGNLADYSSDFDEGTLEGTLGTLPGQDRPQEFLDALNEVWGEELTEFAYSGESYDAAIVIALAAVAAGDDSGEAIASQLQSVANDGTECTTFAECIELLDAGEDIDYVGISGPVEFDENGDQSAAVIGVYEYGADNTPSAVDFVEGELQ